MELFEQFGKEEIISMIGEELYKKVSEKTDLEFTYTGEVLGVKTVAIMLNNKCLDVTSTNELEKFLRGYMCSLNK